jgi:formylmethanofuran dehydrogenase subunit B
MSGQIFEDVACTVCACVCDDLRVTVRDGRIVDYDPFCSRIGTWFERQNSLPSVAATHRGVEIRFDAAIDQAAGILRDARSPLFYGLSQSSTEGQRAAVALADRLGATIDTTASEGHAPSILALQQVGESTCSLGEIRNRADLVIDSKRTETSKLADLVLDIEPGQDFEALWTLRGLLRGIEPVAGSRTGLPLDQLRDLATRMRNCRCGVIFFGYGLVLQPLGNHNVEALLQLVTDLNEYTRFYARRMRVGGDVSGADSVLCWQTGYPFSVNLARGYPRYNPNEYSAADMLERGEADAVLLVGSTRLDCFPPAALRSLEQIPTILIEHPHGAIPFEPTLRITTAVYGIHRHGTAYRMDEVPIPLRPLLESTDPSDGDVLNAIHAAL